MAGDKKSKATDEELSKLFEGIDGGEKPSKPRTKGPGAGAKGAKHAKQASDQTEQELLKELGTLASERPDRPASRSQTPRGVSARGRSPKRAGSARASEDNISGQAPGRKSVESARSAQAITAAAASEQNEAAAKSYDAADSQPVSPSAVAGGWWGGIFKTASAAVKTAESAMKEIQQNEEAKKWAEQFKGNVGALRGLGDELRSRALPTFTNILHTLAPPISSHERLQIHITHDLVGYPSLDQLIYQTFSRVMAQVEGGDLMVIQRGQESSPRRQSDAGVVGPNTSGWSDGPWWRQTAEKRDLGAVKGLTEGSKLAKVSAESYSNDFYGPRGGVEEAAKKAAEVLSETNPVRSSDIFLSIQAINHTAPEDHFGGRVAEKKEEGVVEPPESPEELICFAIYLYDPVHSITFHAITQSIPQKWIDWLDAAAPAETPEPEPEAPTSPSKESAGGFFNREGRSGSVSLPEEIAEIIATGGVDPREWVAEWTEDVLGLGVGVVAQRYVARRMGVGQGGIGRGKAREAALDSGAGEAARAI